MATNEWDDVNKPLPGPLPKPSRVPPLSTLYDKATTGTSAATDVARTLLGGPVAAVGGAWQGPLQALSAGPGYLYRKYAEGDPQGAEEYWKQNVKPAEENMYSMYKRLAEPSTKQGKQFEEDFAAAFEASKLPPVFPGLTSGIPVRGITPTDVRVMGYNAKRIGSQVRDIPTDFRNAQSGLQRVDPVTGKPTLGAKLQGTAESVGDTLSRAGERSDMSPLSSVSALMPDANMYAVRPVDSRILRAKVPEGAAPLTTGTSATGSRGDIRILDPLSTELNKRTLTYDEMMKPHPLFNAYMAQYARNNNAVHDVGIDAALAQRALEKFPDAPSPNEALLALEAFHGGPDSEGMSKEHMAAADAYAKSPLAMAVATQPGVTPIPTSEEFLRRYEASEKWRTNNLPNFITKHLGTEADPALALATQGITFKSPDEILLTGSAEATKAKKNRGAGGMPETGAVQEVLGRKASELYNAEQKWRALGNTASPDAQRAALDKVTSLRKEVENLKIGAAYENIADATVRPATAQSLLGALDYGATQFFPSLTKETNPEALTYQLSRQAIERLGFDDIAKQMHEDILNGKIPVDKVQNMTVEKYIKRNAEARMAAEAAEKAKAQLYVDKVKQRFAGMAQNLPPDAIKLDNAYILESTNATPPEEVLQRASDDTGVLDHCVGQGGSGSRTGDTTHPFTGRKIRSYEPILLLDEPGKPNPNASDSMTSYVRAIHRDNSVLGHVRDAQTGLPVATIQLKSHTQRNGEIGYTLGYVSGPAHSGGTNGPIDPLYQNAIRDYLNKHADNIMSVESALVDNTNIRDTLSRDYDAIGVEAGYRDNRDLRAAYPDLPRFITLDDARAIRNGTYQMPEPTATSTALVTQSAVPAPVTPEVLRGQVTAFANDVLEELHRARVGYFDPDDVAQILAPLVDRHDFSLGVGPLIDQIDRAANTQPNAIAAELMDFAQYLREGQHIPAGRAVAPAPAPGITQNVGDEITTFLDFMREDIAQDLGQDVADRATQIANRALVDQLPNGVPALIADLRDRASVYGNPDVADALNRIAQGIEQGDHQVAALGDFEPDPAHPANAPALPAPANFRNGAYDFVNQSLNAARHTGTYDAQTIDRAETVAHRVLANFDFENAPAELPTMLRDAAGQEQSAMVESILSDMADNLERLPIVSSPQAIAQHLIEIERRPDGTLSTTGISSTVFALLHGQLDYPGFTHIPPGPERARAMQPILEAFTTAADNALGFPITEPEVVPEPEPAPEPAPARVVNYNPVNASVQMTDTGALLEILRQQTDDNAEAEVADVARRYIQGNRPEDLAVLPHLIRTTATGLHADFGYISRELLAREIEQHLAQQAPEQSLLRAPYNELQQAMTDTERTVTTNASARIARSANDYGIDGAEVADMIRGRARTYGNVTINLDNFSPQALEVLARDTSDMIEAQNRARDRRGPFQHGGSMAVRGLPLGNLNIRPSVTANALRGPDTQPISNFIQQVKGMPGVTKEGAKTGLMAFEQMDPAQQMTKAEFVRELLPSSYDIVDLKGAAQDNQHLVDMAEDALDDDPTHIGRLFGLEGRALTAWAKALQDHYNDFASFPANVKRALAKQGIENANAYNNAYDEAYQDAIDTYVSEHAGLVTDEEGYTYSETQRLVQPDMGDQYGEFGVTHPDQHGTYHHFKLAPQSTIGHFRGTYNPADPIHVATYKILDPARATLATMSEFETKPNSYVIEEIQSDAQKTTQQTEHLHQVHGVLFKAAIQKALELGADTVYLPTALQIAGARSGAYAPNHTQNINAKRFVPIYDQAIVKEGLKPLLKTPGVTSKMVNGYHEISFTPEAIEHILNGPGQTIPGYAKGGIVH